MCSSDLDTQIKQLAAQRYRIEINGEVLNILLSSPADATGKIESNIVMGPGRPGSVDKGSPEARGERLLLSTPKTATQARFTWELAF